MLLLGEDIILIDIINGGDGSQGSFVLIILKRCKLSLQQILFILGIKYQLIIARWQSIVLMLEFNWL